MAMYALYVPLKAKAGKEKDVEAFLVQGAKLAQEEKGTVTWYGLNEGGGRYSVFDTFDNEAGQEAHLNGQIARALKANWSTLFEGELQINKIEILAEK